jgi:glycosyltransferase involved in cell wall biosynthesis
MKILAFGDSLKLPTGYGRVSTNVLGYFALKGHEVRQIGWNHYEPPEPITFGDGNGHRATVVLIPPFSNDQFHTESVIQYIKAWNPDLVYNSNDFFTSEALLNRKNEHKFTIANYGIIDGPECSRAYQDIIKKLDIPITPSKYGFEQISKITDKAMYIPHGVNMITYKPSTSAKNEIKRKFGLEGKFVFGCSNRNIWRKQYPNILNAFANMKKKGIEDIAMFIIADPNDAQGNNLYNWSRALGLTISNNPNEPSDVMMYPKTPSILFPLSDDQLAEAYNCFDVMVSGSMAEGFGLCNIEAQACGIPVIICDNSANTELVKGHGWLFPTVKSVTGEEILVPPTIKDITYWYTQPDYGAMRVAMEEAYNNPELTKEYGRKSLEFAKGYDWGKVLPMWDEVIERATKLR